MIVQTEVMVTGPGRGSTGREKWDSGQVNISKVEQTEFAQGWEMGSH